MILVVFHKIKIILKISSPYLASQRMYQRIYRPNLLIFKNRPAIIQDPLSTTSFLPFIFFQIKRLFDLLYHWPSSFQKLWFKLENINKNTAHYLKGNFYWPHCIYRLHISSIRFIQPQQMFVEYTKFRFSLFLISPGLTRIRPPSSGSSSETEEKEVSDIGRVNSDCSSSG